MIKTIESNILAVPTDVLCHQTNCVSENWSGLAVAVFERFPNANTYKQRDVYGKNMLGLVSIHTGDLEIKWVANMYAQMYPGKPKGTDSAEYRLACFDSCLDEVAAFMSKRNMINITFPYNIGCGLAGGHWKDYETAILGFDERNNFNITICKLVK